MELMRGLFMPSSIDYDQIVEELTPCRCNGYCFLKLFLKITHPDRRVIVQLKCIEKLKWSLGELLHSDCGWDYACKKWAFEGYAEGFAKYYNESLTIDEIYQLCVVYATGIDNSSSSESEHFCCVSCG